VEAVIGSLCETRVLDRFLWSRLIVRKRAATEGSGPTFELSSKLVKVRLLKRGA
jgi:hypothetical protein